MERAGTPVRSPGPVVHGELLFVFLLAASTFLLLLFLLLLFLRRFFLATPAASHQH